MLKKSSIRWIVLISAVAIAFGASGCAKKQVVKEEVVAKPSMEAKKEVAKPEAPKAVEKPREEAPAPKAKEAPIEKPKEEAWPQPKPPEKIREEARPEAPKAVEKTKKEPPAPRAQAVPIDLALLGIHFAFDDYNLSPKAKENLEKIASWMSKNPAVKIQIEGHACEIGTNEYNLALGERRANSAKKYLEGLGASPARISTISYGEERPLNPGHTEEARSQNRRDEFMQMK